MTNRRLHKIADELAFAAGNWWPRRALTRFVHWMARRREPWIVHSLIWLWQHLGGLDLSDAAETQFETLNACFTRRLRAGARPLDPDTSTLVAPCDGIVMACGTVRDGLLLQAKGQHFTVGELLGDQPLADCYQYGRFLTLRLRPDMYHRFHAPATGHIQRVDWLPGELWNVHPPAVRRVGRLYCRNERAVIRLQNDRYGLLTLVPVAALLVGSLRVHGVEPLLGPHVPGPSIWTPEADSARVTRGDELGWFEQGSTIIVLLPPTLLLAPAVATGAELRAGCRIAHAAGHTACHAIDT
ncbi:MAG: archaetidylserine decarboxylase [Pseudomonadales bacterium]